MIFFPSKSFLRLHRYAIEPYWQLGKSQMIQAAGNTANLHSIDAIVSELSTIENFSETLSYQSPDNRGSMF